MFLTSEQRANQRRKQQEYEAAEAHRRRQAQLEWEQSTAGRIANLERELAELRAAQGE